MVLSQDLLVQKLKEEVAKLLPQLAAIIHVYLVLLKAN